MGIYIGGCGKVAVTEPFLYLLHRYAVCEQQRSAAVSQKIQTFGFLKALLCIKNERIEYPGSGQAAGSHINQFGHFQSAKLQPVQIKYLQDSPHLLAAHGALPFIRTLQDNTPSLTAALLKGSHDFQYMKRLPGACTQGTSFPQCLCHIR